MMTIGRLEEDCHAMEAAREGEGSVMIVGEGDDGLKRWPWWWKLPLVS